eukprot:446790-Pleurochrysis_carterae.AAC.1
MEGNANASIDVRIQTRAPVLPRRAYRRLTADRHSASLLPNFALNSYLGSTFLAPALATACSLQPSLSSCAAAVKPEK